MQLHQTMSELPRPEPHAISDSEPELAVVGKKKETPRRAKGAETTQGAGTSGLDQPSTLSVYMLTLVSLPCSQETNELS